MVYKHLNEYLMSIKSKQRAIEKILPGAVESDHQKSTPKKC